MTKTSPTRIVVVEREALAPRAPLVSLAPLTPFLDLLDAPLDWVAKSLGQGAAQTPSPWRTVRTPTDGINKNDRGQRAENAAHRRKGVEATGSIAHRLDALDLETDRLG